MIRGVENLWEGAIGKCMGGQKLMHFTLSSLYYILQTTNKLNNNNINTKINTNIIIVIIITIFLLLLL